MSTTPSAAGAFVGTSEMHARVNALDWSLTSVGPVATWPQSLRATIKTLLGSRYPMILLWGPDLIQIYNEAYISLIGRKHPAALGRSIRETQAESWEIIGPMIREVMSTGVPNWVPAQQLPLERSGYREESYFSLSYSAVDDDGGRISGMLCVCSEVTEGVVGERRMRLLGDLALKAGETQSVETACRDLSAVMAGHPLDVPFALLYVSEADGKTLTLRGAVGLAPDSPASPSAVRLETDAVWPLARAMAGETVWVEQVEQRLGVHGGPWQDPVSSALVLPIASADPAASLGVLVAGVSPNRALDEGYRSFYDLLVGQVSVALRNARAHEDERKRAQALAELDRAKTAFFSNVSHEFRTPLTLMLGPLEDLLVAKRLEPEDRKELEVVHRNAGRLLRLVNTLLDFSRLEAGRVDASFEPTDVAGLTADLASSFRSAVERAGLILTVDCAPLSAPAYVDRDMWEKIVLNLLSNALKFTFEGGISLRVSELEQAFSVEISDTGTGIAAAELPHLFERFHRVKGARSRTHEGSGIGLALVRELVELHGGVVSVSSTESRGTAFRVVLPLGRAHLPKERIGVPRRLASTATASAAFVNEALRWLPSASSVQERSDLAEQPALAGRRGRILVADDNADMREYLARVLGPSFDVVLAEDGQAALEMVRSSGPFDLVLTDVMMPRLGGFGLLKALREDAGTRAIPVVMLSARAGEEASVEGLEAGADDYLVKPFSARELVARTRSTLELARMRQEIAARDAREASLVESLRARDEFLSIASHELKTPLTPLQVQIRSLERHLNQIAGGERSAEWLKERLDMLKRQGERLERLVDELLDVSTLTGAELRLNPETVSLDAVIREALVRLEEAGELQRSACRVSVRSEEEVVGVWDRSRLNLLVTNLVENALKFGAGGPVEISASAQGSMATLSVADHGIGIAAEDHTRIFRRFERAVSERHYGGMGLGLWVVQRIVEAMGGVIEVESELGRGARFLVRVPVGPPSSRADGARESVTAAATALRSGL